jgi:hypothetical protein
MDTYNMYSGTTKARTSYGSLDHHQLQPPPRQAGPPAPVYERRPVPDYYQDLNDSDDDSDDSEIFRRRRVYMSSDDEEEKEPQSPRRRRKAARVPPLTPADLRISPAMKAEMEAEQKRSSNKRTSKNQPLDHLTQERRPSNALPYPPTPSTLERTDSRRAEKPRPKPKSPSRRNTAEKATDSAGGSTPNVSLGSQSFIKEVTRNVLGERFTRRPSFGGSIRSGTGRSSMGG